MLLLQVVDIIILSTIRGVTNPLVDRMSVLHTVVTQDTLHIKARGVA